MTPKPVDGQWMEFSVTVTKNNTRYELNRSNSVAEYIATVSVNATQNARGILRTLNVRTHDRRRVCVDNPVVISKERFDPSVVINFISAENDDEAQEEKRDSAKR